MLLESLLEEIGRAGMVLLEVGQQEGLRRQRHPDQHRKAELA
jgi:hypothetical protein